MSPVKGPTAPRIQLFGIKAFQDEETPLVKSEVRDRERAT